MIPSRLAGSLAAFAVLVSAAALALPGSALAGTPVCNPSTVTVSPGATVTLAPDCTDPDGHAMSYFLAGQTDPSAGQVTNAADGSLVLAAAPGYVGEFTLYYFAYKTGGSMNPHSGFTPIDVTVADSPPVCTGSSSATVSHGHSVSAPFNCSDADGDAFTVAVLSTTEGTATVSGSAVDYDSDVNDDGFSGPQTITLQATETADPSVQSSPFDVDVQVTDADPICTQADPSPVEVSSVAGSTVDLPFSCSDADGDPLVIDAQNPISAFQLISPSLVRFTTQPWMSPGDSWRYTFEALESPGGSRAGNLVLTVNVVADVRPVCTITGPTTHVVSHTAQTTFAYTCTDFEGDPITPTVTGASHGDAEITSPGVITYTPLSGSSYTGADTISLAASEHADPTISSTPVTMNVTITDDAPVCAQTGGSASVSHTGSTTLSYSCTDADGDTLQLWDANTTNGSATPGSYGAVDYAPDAADSGPEQVTVQVAESDNHAVRSAPFSLDVDVTDTPPVCVQTGTPSVHAGQTITVTFACIDTDGDPLAINQYGWNSGTVATTGTFGELSYTTAFDQPGPQYLMVEVWETDAMSVHSDPIALYVDVTDAPPVCTDSTTSVVHGRSAIGGFSCSDPEGDPFTVQIVGGPAGGSANLAGSTVAYNSTAGSIGPQVVHVRAFEDGDTLVASNIAAVSFDVTNAVPVCAQTSQSALITLGGLVTSASLPFSCTDADGDPLTLTVATGGTHGTTILDGQSASYTPTTTGSDTISVTASDGFANATLSWMITVLPVTPIIVAPVVITPPAITPVIVPPVVVTPPIATGPTRLEVEKPGALKQNKLSVKLTCPAAMGKVCKAFVRPSGKGYVRSLGTRTVTVELGTADAFKLTIPAYAAKTLRAYAGKNLRFIVTVTTRDSLGKKVTVRKQIVVHVPLRMDVVALIDASNDLSPTEACTCARHQ